MQTVRCSKFWGNGTRFYTRISEHKAAMRLGHKNNACFKHWSETGHDMDWNYAHLISQEDNWLRRQVIESSCIVKFQNFNNMMSTLSIV